MKKKKVSIKKNFLLKNVSSKNKKFIFKLNKWKFLKLTS